MTPFSAIGDYNGHVGLGVKCSKEAATATTAASSAATSTASVTETSTKSSSVATQYEKIM